MFSSSPRLIAAYHVFLRLPTPRHPPDALYNLSRKISPLFPIQLSTNKHISWWSWTALNRRPPACKAGALPTELQPLILVGLERLELSTSRLSGVRSNHLSYRPEICSLNEPYGSLQVNSEWECLFLKGGDPAAGSPTATLLRLHSNYRPYRKRLPPSRVGSPASGKTNFRSVTGGVYKARERIHPSMLISNY